METTAVRLRADALRITALVASIGLAEASFAAPVGPRPTKPAGLNSWLTGNAADAVVDLSQGPGLLLMGGGSDVTVAFADRIFPRIPGGNIVVLRASGSDGYNDYFFEEITTGPNRPASVETLRIDTRAKADLAYVEWALAGAEFIWMAGGDQSDYTDNWRGTKVEAGLRAAWERGAFIGGTSAGMAVLGEFIYDPGPNPSLTTTTAAANPYNASMRLTARLFDAPWMNGVVTDTHFKNRDRMGRLMGIMGYLREEGRADASILGIGASEATSLFVDRDGKGIVDTHLDRGDAVYVLVEDANTERLQVNPGEVLQLRGLYRYRLPAGATFDFATRTASVPGMRLSLDGTAVPVYTPADPYSDAVAEGGSTWVITSTPAATPQ
jgi:cyanophycinase